jgi:hypothetical protein
MPAVDHHDIPMCIDVKILQAKWVLGRLLDRKHFFPYTIVPVELEPAHSPPFGVMLISMIASLGTVRVDMLSLRVQLERDSIDLIRRLF